MISGGRATLPTVAPRIRITKSGGWAQIVRPWVFPLAEQRGGRAGGPVPLGMYVRVPFIPWRRLLKLAGDLDEHVLPAICGDQLHAGPAAVNQPSSGGGAPRVGVNSRS